MKLKQTRKYLSFTRRTVISHVLYLQEGTEINQFDNLRIVI